MNGKLAITEDIMTDLVYTKISWVRDQDAAKSSGKQVRGSDQLINCVLISCYCAFVLDGWLTIKYSSSCDDYVMGRSFLRLRRLNGMIVCTLF